MSEWAGRKVRRLVDLTLATKGTVCQLCGLDGADSADHDPPRSVLIAAGMPDPDAPEYLWPSHRHPCNINRKARAITPELRAELRAARLAHLGITEADTPRGASSPRFARRRATL